MLSFGDAALISPLTVTKSPTLESLIHSLDLSGRFREFCIANFAIGIGTGHEESQFEIRLRG